MGHRALKGVVCDRLLFLGLQKSLISESSQNHRFWSAQNRNFRKQSFL